MRTNESFTGSQSLRRNAARPWVLAAGGLLLISIVLAFGGFRPVAGASFTAAFLTLVAALWLHYRASVERPRPSLPELVRAVEKLTEALEQSERRLTTAMKASLDEMSRQIAEAGEEMQRGSDAVAQVGHAVIGAAERLSVALDDQRKQSETSENAANQQPAADLEPLEHVPFFDQRSSVRGAVQAFCEGSFDQERLIASARASAVRWGSGTSVGTEDRVRVNFDNVDSRILAFQEEPASSRYLLVVREGASWNPAFAPIFDVHGEGPAPEGMKARVQMLTPTIAELEETDILRVRDRGTVRIAKVE